MYNKILDDKVKNAIKNYSIIELKLFIDAMEVANDKAERDSDIRYNTYNARKVAIKLLYEKTCSFLNGL
jgi:ABC-type molybdate transport system ATPase subunit